MSVIDWLLDGDPSIRWQVMRDLSDAAPSEVAAERARVATEGWGGQLLGLQGPDGLWDGGTYRAGWVDESKPFFDTWVPFWPARKPPLKVMVAFWSAR